MKDKIAFSENTMTTADADEEQNLTLSENLLAKADIPEGQIPRVAAIHDICGYGNCSLGIALPVLSCGGIDACPIPTSVFSSHTAMSSYSFYDTSPTLNEFLQAWKDLSVRVDGIYTGFLGSSDQIQFIVNVTELWPKAICVIDPVMGDHGLRYQTYSDEMCEEMKRLIPKADVLTPNLTEASILLGEAYYGQEISSTLGENICRKLIDKGAKNVVLKGIQRDYTIYNAVMGENIPYQEIPNELHPSSLHGTGDLFAACITAGIFSAHDLVETVRFAANFVYHAICLSVSQEGFAERGVSYEPLLGQVLDFCTKRK